MQKIRTLLRRLGSGGNFKVSFIFAACVHFFSANSAAETGFFSVGLAAYKPDNNSFSVDRGYRFAAHFDVSGYYFAGSFDSGEIESRFSYTDWDIWSAEHVTGEKGHVFDRLITLEAGRRFNSFYVAATLDAIHIDQWSLRYDENGRHNGYRHDFWKHGTGFVFGYQGDFNGLKYKLDIGAVSHIANDYRLRAEAGYRLGDYEIVVSTEDYADLDFTTHSINFRYRF